VTKATDKKSVRVFLRGGA